MSDQTRLDLPWAFIPDEGGFGNVKALQGEIICPFVTNQSGKAIVRAVNSHAALVEACEAAEFAISHIMPDAGILKELRDALTLAKEGQ